MNAAQSDSRKPVRTRSLYGNPYPLPATLTRRIVGYLSVYRIVIASLLAAGNFDLIRDLQNQSFSRTFAALLIIAYLLFASFELFMARRHTSNAHRLVRYALLADVLFLSGLLFVLGGLGSGVGTLLVFTSALAGMLLPLRFALFITSVATLALIGQAVTGLALSLYPLGILLPAGMYGATAMVACMLCHRLAYWARDYRVTAEKQESQIADLEKLNEVIIRNMSTGVLVIDADRRIKLMNEYAWFLLGSPKVRELLLADLSPRLDRTVEKWQANPSVELRPVVLETSQANVLPAFAVMPGEDEPGALVFLNDESVISKRALELSANSLAKLSGSIAHEIRNPLAALTHAAQLLDESPSITLNDMRLTNIILDQSKRMNGIVENILQLSRQEQSRPEPVELNQFLKDLAKEFGTTQTAKDLDFEILVETGKTHVVFDKSQLHQSLWKLLDNTVHHASVKRPPRAQLKMRKDESAGYCVITVQDNGPGIPKSRITDIFEPFFTTRKAGSGLGLYIARQLCEANQAELTVDSQPGVGTAFHIRMGLAPRGRTRSRSVATAHAESGQT
ncbi:sensor histidine kinase [Elongatibacter sediminis]|uniref:histidine kinase n=1 Tax=Elongatibacter sediminis TaxID=3119006 RepID=A0AAW9RH49_9GAMM